MAKKINMKTVAPLTLAAFSEYHKAYIALVDINAKYKDDMESLTDKKAIIISDRQEAIKGGKSVDEATREFSIDKVQQEIDALIFSHKEEVAPYNKALRKVQKMVPDTLYNAYALAMTDADYENINNVGIVPIKKKDKVEYRHVSVGYLSQIKSMAYKMGFANTGDDKASDKFARTIAKRCGGMSPDKKGGYIKLKSESSFKDLVILAIIYYAVIERQQWEVTSDNGLAIVQNTEAFN